MVQIWKEYFGVMYKEDKEEEVIVIVHGFEDAKGDRYFEISSK